MTNKKNNSVKFKYRNEIKAYSLMAIPLIFWLVFFAAAFIFAIVISFTNMKTSVANITRFTFDNYIRIFDKNHELYDAEFWSSLWVSVKWAFFTTIGSNFFGLLLGFMLTRIPRGKKIFLAVLYWPALVSAVVGSNIIQLLFDGSESGIVNSLLMSIGALDNPINYFNEEKYALFALMFTSVFLGFSGGLLIYYAAIIGVPDTYLEAASLETDSKLKEYIYITLPLISNTITLNLVNSIINGFKVIGPMQLITSGGSKTQSSVLYVYYLAFERSKMGVASAYAMVLFLVVMIFSVIQMKLNNKEVSYE